MIVGGCTADARKPANQTLTEQPPVQFRSLLKRDESIKRFAVEFIYTPPVPVENGKVVVYAFQLRGLPPQPPKVLAPDYRIIAEYPSGDVVSIEQVTAAQLGLTLIDNRHIGEVRLPQEYRSKGYKEFEVLEQEFERAYADAVEAALAGRALPPPLCRRLQELLPIFAKEPLIPLLRKTNPTFFDELDRCAKQ